MKNQREVLDRTVEKIDKFVFNIRNINRILAIVIAIFLVLLPISVSRQSKELIRQEEIYNKMLEDLKAFKLGVIYSNVTPNDGQVDASKKDMEAPIFNNAKDAVVFAFEKFYNYKMFEIKGYGTTNAEAVGQNVEIQMNSYSCKFESGNEFDKLVRKETKTNFGQSDAVEIYFKNNERYNRRGQNIKRENNEWVADFYTNFEKSNYTINHHITYLVNNSTVKYNRLFSFVRDANKQIQYYKATVMLDTVNSVKEYAQNIMEEGGTSYPKFSEIELSCIIDRDGHLMSYSVIEKMTISKKIVIDITTTTTNQFNYIIVSHDKTPSFAEPSV